MSHLTRLADRAVLAVSGPEAGQFLQGLITNDIEALQPGGTLYAALLTPQGKILFDFLIFERSGDFLLDVVASQREALRKRLTLYRLRAKVDIAIRDELAVVASWGEGAAASDPRHPKLGARAIEDAGSVAATSDDYLAHRLALGIPESEDFGQDKIFALDAGLDELHGVAFDKGCYVGQELTARMKHRGTARKRLLPVETLDGTHLVADAAVSANEREIGTVMSTYGSRGFALIRLDRLEQAGDAETKAGSTPVRIVKPPWPFRQPTA
jgi:folate-binding protein YgfZ